MNAMIALALPSARQMRTYAQNLLQGIDPQLFARKPTPGGVQLQINHPAFNYGHLSLYPALILEMLHLPYEDLRMAETFSELFRIDTPCHDDADGSRYPSMAEIVLQFTRGYDALLERISEVSDQALQEVTPGERVARFPVKGNFLVHLMTSHLAGHLGQVSAWRRAMNLPPV